jgi:hypothetical protein
MCHPSFASANLAERLKKEQSLLKILRVRKDDGSEPVSGTRFEKFMGRIEKLRNDLAHSSEIHSNDWREIMKDVKVLEGFLEDLESSDENGSEAADRAREKADRYSS